MFTYHVYSSQPFTRIPANATALFVNVPFRISWRILKEKRSELTSRDFIHNSLQRKKGPRHVNYPVFLFCVYICETCLLLGLHAWVCCVGGMCHE